MRINVYCLTYPNGHTITQYETGRLIDEVNKYNTEQNIKHKFNLNKIHRYTGKASLPPFYTSFTKIPLGQFINAEGQRLCLVNYRERFNTITTPMAQSTMTQTTD